MFPLQGFMINTMTETLNPLHKALSGGLNTFHRHLQFFRIRCILKGLLGVNNAVHDELA